MTQNVTVQLVEFTTVAYLLAYRYLVQLYFDCTEPLALMTCEVSCTLNPKNAFRMKTFHAQSFIDHLLPPNVRSHSRPLR